MNPCRHLAPLMLSNYHSILTPNEELVEDEDSDATQDEGSDIEDVLPDPLVPDPLVLPDHSVMAETIVLPDPFVLPDPVLFPDTFTLPDPFAVLNPFVLPHHYVLPDTVDIHVLPDVPVPELPVSAFQAPFDPGANVVALEMPARRMTRSEARRRNVSMN